MSQAMPGTKRMLKAVTDRDADFDGRFFYAVVTTGVYCKPSCASRPARPENLRFYSDTAAAEAAGFRPCKRCKPDEMDAMHERMVGIARHIEANFDATITLTDLASRFGLTPSRLQRTFKATFGLTPRGYQDGLRQRRFQTLLRDGSDVTAAMYEAGFGSSSRVYGNPARNIGMTPGAYRAGGKGETIHYVTRDTALGKIMMAATSRGVCFVQFGDSIKGLRAALEAEFPNATLQPSAATKSAELNDWMDALNAYLERETPRPDIPLDMHGTAFQIKVWKFLLGTGDGDVVSYAEVAKGIGRAKAFRAAASACGKNRIAVLIPCHRVLRGDGGIGGYRWGVERKRALLAAERSQASR